MNQTDLTRPLAQAARGKVVSGTPPQNPLLGPIATMAVGGVMHHPVAGAVIAGARAAAAAQNNAVRRMMVNRLLNPDVGSAPFVARPPRASAPNLAPSIVGINAIKNALVNNQPATASP
jgi:hypothetical protein